MESATIQSLGHEMELNVMFNVNGILVVSDSIIGGERL